MYAGENAEGLYPEMIAMIFDEMNVQYEIKALPWKRALMLSREGKVGVGGAYKNTERLKIYDYSEPILAEELKVYVLKGQEFDYSSIDDLKGKTIGLNFGWSYGDKMADAKKRNIFKVKEVKNNAHLFRYLIGHHVDAIIADRVSADYEIKRQKYTGFIVALPKPFTVNYGHLIFFKSMKKIDFLNHFNKTMNLLKKQGQFKKIGSPSL